MRIFLTGANGFFGSRVAGQLLERGHELVLLVRPGRGGNAPRAGAVTLVEGDLTVPESWEGSLAGIDCVLHTAAVVQTWARDASVFYRVNVTGTMELVHRALERGAGRVVYLSSFLALAPSPDATPLDETAPIVRENHYNDYERTKYLANLEISRLIDSGAPVTALYPTVMYGPGPLTAGNLIVNMVIDHMRGRLPARLGDGAQTWNFVHVDDVAASVVAAVESGERAGKYILGGENVTLARFFEIVELVTGKPQPRLALPWGVARLAGAAEELLAFLTGRMPQTTRGAVELFRLNWPFDSSRAVTKLGHNPRLLEDGLRHSVEWIRREGLAP
jgi:farnesol dehydrogenase